MGVSVIRWVPFGTRLTDTLVLRCYKGIGRIVIPTKMAREKPYKKMTYQCGTCPFGFPGAWGVGARRALRTALPGEARNVASGCRDFMFIIDYKSFLIVVI